MVLMVKTTINLVSTLLWLSIGTFEQRFKMSSRMMSMLTVRS